MDIPKTTTTDSVKDVTETVIPTWSAQPEPVLTPYVVKQSDSNPKVDHPEYYSEGGIEAIDVIEAWELGFSLGNVVKYISRAGKKDPKTEMEDLEKAQWYLQRHIDKLKSKLETQ